MKSEDASGSRTLLDAQLRGGGNQQLATKRRGLALWAVLRVPLVLLLLFIFKDWIISLFDDPTYLTHRAMEILGTPLARVLLFLVLASVLALGWAGARQLGELRGYLVAIGLAALLLFVLLAGSGSPQKLALPALALLATNLLPDQIIRRAFSTGASENRFMTVGIGVAEVFFTGRYLNWVVELWTGRRQLLANSWVAAIPAILLASGATALLIRSPYLTDVEQGLRLGPSARIFARGDVNWLELDAEQRHLFVTGHGLPHILRYDLSDLGREPLKSPVDTGRAQAFAYEPVARELYVYKKQTRTLLVLDDVSLELKRSFPVDGLASGDFWMAADRETDTVIIVSEADTNDGQPFIVVDRLTGEVRDKRDIDAGNILHLAEGARLYLSFFRRSERLIEYSLGKLDITKEVPAPQRADRMVYHKHNNEVLLSAPAHSQIVRYDADSLTENGRIDAIIGVRTLAVDNERNLLLAGSFLTGEVAIIDLDTFKMVSRVYLGPWLRTIQVDGARGVAYVSSNGALYELRYDNLR